jgi:hypothetical protein
MTTRLWVRARDFACDCQGHILIILYQVKTVKFCQKHQQFYQISILIKFHIIITFDTSIGRNVYENIACTKEFTEMTCTCMHTLASYRRHNFVKFKRNSKITIIAIIWRHSNAPYIICRTHNHKEFCTYFFAIGTYTNKNITAWRYRPSYSHLFNLTLNFPHLTFLWKMVIQSCKLAMYRSKY